MSASTPIAILVEAMLANAVEHQAIVCAVEAAERAGRRPKSKAAGNRGIRLPEDWKPTDEDLAYAAAFRMPDALIMLEAQRFKNYWIAKSGAGATKCDWSATWRNWILNAMEMRHDATNRYSRSGAIPVAGRSPAGADAILAGMGRLSRRLADNRMAAQSLDRETGTDGNAPRSIGFESDAKD